MDYWIESFATHQMGGRAWIRSDIPLEMRLPQASRTRCICSPELQVKTHLSDPHRCLNGSRHRVNDSAARYHLDTGALVAACQQVDYAERVGRVVGNCEAEVAGCRAVVVAVDERVGRARCSEGTGVVVVRHAGEDWAGERDLILARTFG